MKNLILIRISILLFFLTLISGCYYDEEMIFEGLPSNVSFKNDVSPILTLNCTTTGCHDAVPAHAPSLVPEKAISDLTSGKYINTLEPEKSAFYQVVKSGEMPPTSVTVGINDQKIILAWITEGAKDN